MTAMSDLWRPASFRGVSFHVDDFDRTGGRRGPDHEFPFKETGFPEDMGGQTGTHAFNAYVVRTVRDADYGARRDALIAALNQPGPGELAHPVFGTILVQVRSWSMKEAKGAMGLATFSLSFVEASEPTYPTAVRPAAAGMPKRAATAHTAAANAFAATFSVAGKSDYLRDRAGEQAETAGEVFSKSASTFGVPVDIDGLVAAIASGIAAGKDGADLAASIAALPRAFTAWYEEPWKKLRNADGTYRGISNMRGYGPLSSTAPVSLFRAFDYQKSKAAAKSGSAVRRQESANAAAFAALVRVTSVVEAARVAPFVDWHTVEEAEAARETIADALADEAATTTDDGIFVALSDLRLLVSQTVPPDGGRLPSLLDYVPDATMPSLVLAYRLYGEADRADELVAMNGIRHPGFVPGGRSIQVLSHV